jgi:hypothetical protein
LEWFWTIISFGIVVIISLLALILPMRFGAKRLSEYII